MGGYGSGRYTGMPAVEDGLTLDVNHLIRKKIIIPGKHVAGAITWTNTRTGKKMAEIGYEAAMLPEEANWVRLHYSVNSHPMNYKVALVTSPCNYGGSRWWWLCPLTARTVSKLHLPPGGKTFASRKAYRLPYRSQRQAGIDRTHQQQARIYEKLGAKYDHFEGYIPPRPKGMHIKTYNRLVADLEAAMEAQDAVYVAGLMRLMGRFGGLR
jgi:hypothetical protein